MTWKNRGKTKLFLIAGLSEYSVTCLMIFSSFVLFLQSIKKSPSIYFGKLKPVALLFFPAVTVSKHSPHVQIRNFIYSTSYIILQELEENFSSLNTGFVPRVSHQWFKHGWQEQKQMHWPQKDTWVVGTKKIHWLFRIQAPNWICKRKAECFLLLCCTEQGERFWMTSMQSQSELRETKIGVSDRRPYGFHGISTGSVVSSHELCLWYLWNCWGNTF